MWRTDGLRVSIRLAVGLLALVLMAGCSIDSTSTFTVTGTVDDNTKAVVVPLLPSATVNVDAGASGEKDDKPSLEIVGLGSATRLSFVDVEEGEKVSAGQVVARVDDVTLKAQIEVAKANQKAAKAQVEVLEAAVDKTYDKQRDIEDAKAKPQLDSGIGKAKDASRKLNEASDKVVDARATLTDARKLAEITADSSGIPVELARTHLNMTELTAPVSGVVTYAARTGDVLAPGASMAEIRPDVPATVTAWLSPAQATQVCVGDAAAVHGDWMPPGSGAKASVTLVEPSIEDVFVNLVTAEARSAASRPRPPTAPMKDHP